jgi:hypothetical protein
MRVTTESILDADGLTAVKAWTRRKMRATQRRMLPRRPRSLKSLSHPPVPTRACTAPGASKVHRKAAVGHTRRQWKIKAKMTLEDHVKPVKMNTPTGSRAS